MSWQQLLLPSLAVASILALVAGPLGCVMVWRRMAYFSDALAHSTLLGIGLAALVGFHPLLGMVAVALLLVALLLPLEQQQRLSYDTLLALCSHSLLAVGLILASIQSDISVNLLQFLYGDVLAVNAVDMIVVGTLAILVLLVLKRIWRRLLAVTIHAELAFAEGVKVTRLSMQFTILLALFIAVAMKIVGVLLVTSLLVIPAAGARQVAKTPEQMAFIASVFGVIAVWLGIGCSWWYDWPAGPAIVCISAVEFALVLLIQKCKR